MKYHFCTVLLLFFLRILVLQTADCCNFKERCHKDKNECEGVWSILENFCGFSGSNCQIKDSQNCNTTIHYITQKYPEFRACTCAEDMNCSIRRLLGKQCTAGKVNTIPTEPIKPNILQKSSLKYSRTTGVITLAKLNDCYVAKQHCKLDRNCFHLYENFKNCCITNANLCTTHGSHETCLSAWSELKSTVMGNCGCLYPAKEKCLNIWNGIYNNSCLKHAKKMESTLANTEEMKEKNNVPGAVDSVSNDLQSIISLEWELSSLTRLEYSSPMSCFEVATLCVRDEVCNRHLAALLQICKVNGNVCNITGCQRATKSFYTTMPFRVSELLAFCDCAQSDEDCKSTGDDLHSKPCAVQAETPISCVDVIHRCLKDELCRQGYETYLSKCWCGNNENCLRYTSIEELSCSGDDNCKAAYISTLGTDLHMQCTCSPALGVEDQRLCRIFYHMIHSKSCFKRVTHRNFHKLNSESVILTGSHSLQNGTMIYIAAYISGVILVSAIILLALLQARACRTRQKENVPKGNVSESLMDS
ncbi:hypothetical protein XENTR_v10014285 [Xenopus tropicalis]|nr:hypothetical protein XENTR_v10014285 [Xenopus tropicalis]